MFTDNVMNSLLFAKHIVVLTGAGMSAESGIATFRDAQTGLWQHFDPYRLASVEGYQADKSLVWGWYEWRRSQVLKSEPHAGHFALAQLTDYVERLTLVTQNVDDLHERAGSRGVIHLHGSLHQPRCFQCGSLYELPSAIPSVAEADERIEPPTCRFCQGSIRPGVVWFGELLPEKAWLQVEDAIADCDVLFSIGTSSLVNPAAKIPDMALIRGAMIIQINPDSTPLDSKAHHNFRGKAGEVLPELLEALAKFT